MHSRPHDVAMYVGLYVRLVLRVCGKIAQGGGGEFFWLSEFVQNYVGIWTTVFWEGGPENICSLATDRNSRLYKVAACLQVGYVYRLSIAIPRSLRRGRSSRSVDLAWLCITIEERFDLRTRIIEYIPYV